MFQFNSTQSFSYLGEFWYSSYPDNKFPGIFSYSAEKGPTLKVIEFPCINIEEKTEKTIHGFVEKIGKVTILYIHSSSLESLSYKIRNFDFTIAITGIHCSMTDEIFDEMQFHFPGIDSFCSTRAPNSYVVSNKKSLIKNAFFDDNFEIEIKQVLCDSIELSGGVLSDSLMNKLYPNYRNKQLQLWEKENYDVKNNTFTIQGEKLIKELSKIKESLTITKPFYCICIKSKNKTIKDYLDIRFELEKLFSIFLLTPIYSDECIISDVKNTYPLMKKIEIGRKTNFSFLQLPVTINNIKNDFTSIIHNWKEILSRTLLNTLITDKFYNNAKPGYQQFCIVLAIIGGWQTLYGKNTDYNKRYENFLQENLHPIDVSQIETSIKDNDVDKFEKDIKDRLYKLDAGEDFEKIATTLNDLRNCILHWDEKLANSTKEDKALKRCQKILNNTTKIINLNEILFILLVYAIYSKLGIVLSKQQKLNLLDKIANWESCSIYIQN